VSQSANSVMFTCSELLKTTTGIDAGGIFQILLAVAVVKLLINLNIAIHVDLIMRIESYHVAQ